MSSSRCRATNKDLRCDSTGSFREDIFIAVNVFLDLFARTAWSKLGHNVAGRLNFCEKSPGAPKRIKRISTPATWYAQILSLAGEETFAELEKLYWAGGAGWFLMANCNSRPSFPAYDSQTARRVNTVTRMSLRPSVKAFNEKDLISKTL